MDLLWLSNETPAADGGGGQRRQYHQIAALVHAGIDVTVASIAGPQDDASLRSLVTVCRVDLQGRLRNRRAVSGLVKAVCPSRAVIAHGESIGNFAAGLERAGVPFLVDFHNVYSRWHESLGEEGEAREWRSCELAALEVAVTATACSPEEAEALRTLGSSTPIVVAPHGVEPTEWPAGKIATARQPIVAMFGSWNHRPNRIAVQWFADYVWPAVRSEVPDARLQLLGPHHPPISVTSVAGIHVVGRVPSLAEALGQASVVIVPIREGVGTRVKFVESLASGPAVVATTAGAEGFEADGAFLRADDADSFATACVELLRDDSKALALGRRGRELALSRYSWSNVSEPLLSFVLSGASAA